MTALAEPDYYDDSDYRSELDAKYEEGFGQSSQFDDEAEDALDDLFSGLFDDEDDDDFAPVKPKSAPKRAAAKATASSIKSTPRAVADTQTMTTSVSRPLEPVLAVEVPVAGGSAVEVFALEAPAADDSPVDAARGAAERARAAADDAAAAAKRAVTDAVAKAAAAKAAAAEASAAERAAQDALGASAAAEEMAQRADAELELALSAQPVVAEEAPQGPISASGEPEFAAHIAPVNRHVDFLRKLRPGFEVPYVDPMHSVDECRIVSLFSNTGEADPRGYVWAGDDAAATRLLGLQYQLGLRPEWIMPWNAYPWFTPGESNGKLTPEQLHAGLKPLLAFLKAVPRASAIVAHGTEANRLAQMLLKTDNPLIWRRGLKVYKARSLHGRAFAGSKERQTEWLIDMGRAYADAMARAGLKPSR